MKTAWNNNYEQFCSELYICLAQIHSHFYDVAFVPMTAYKHKLANRVCLSEMYDRIVIHTVGVVIVYVSLFVSMKLCVWRLIFGNIAEDYITQEYMYAFEGAKEFFLC